MDLAKASAAMESIEAYHAENISTEIITASFRELSTQARVCNPHDLNLHPRSVYHENLRIDWLKGIDLLSQETVFVPYDLVHVVFLSKPLNLPVFKQSSNGLASGNHLLEAISHAICEVVERDASLLWQINQKVSGENVHLVDLQTIDSPIVQSLLDKVKRASIGVHLWEQTSDVGIPSFGCVVFEGDTLSLTQPHGVFGGYGGHLSKEIAVVRAVTEAVQARLTYISGARDDLYRSAYKKMGAANQFGRWQRVFANARPSIDYKDLPSLETSSFDQDVQVELALLKKAGFEQLIVVDLTIEEIGIPVVRAIIPGAEYFYEKPPVRLGRRAWSSLLGGMLKWNQ